MEEVREIKAFYDEAEKMALTKSNKNAGVGAKPQQQGVCDFAGNETKQVNRA